MKTDIPVKRVVIIGGAYYGNRGAALMLKNSIKKIRESVDCHVVFDVWAEHIQENRKLCDDSGVNFIEFVPWKFALLVVPSLFFSLFFKGSLSNRSGSPHSLLGSCRRADLFFDISGISFLDERKPIFLLYDTLIALPAIWLDKPIIKAAQALGPFCNSLNRKLATVILPRITWVYARGAESLENLKKLGLRNVGLAADVGFFEAASSYCEEMTLLKSLRKPIIGISVSSVVYEKCQKMGIDYVKVTNEFIRYLIDHLKCSVIIIPHAVRNGESMRNNDVPVINKILENSTSENVHYFKHIVHPYELRTLISGCDFLLASRFHAMISSLSVGVPVIILGWSHKYQEVLEMFDLPDCFITYNELNAQAVIRLFEKLFPQREILAAKINSKIDEVRKLSDLNFHAIPGLLNVSGS